MVRRAMRYDKYALTYLGGVLFTASLLHTPQLAELIAITGRVAAAADHWDEGPAGAIIELAR
jgi:hypothetical protein